MNKARYSIILNTLPEAGSSGSYWVYTGLRGAAEEELPASGKVLRIMLYNSSFHNTLLFSSGPVQCTITLGIFDYIALFELFFPEYEQILFANIAAYSLISGVRGNFNSICILRLQRFL